MKTSNDECWDVGELDERPGDWRVPDEGEERARGESWLERRRILRTVSSFCMPLFGSSKASSSMGSGIGVMQSRSATEVGRPVMTPRVRSNP